MSHLPFRRLVGAALAIAVLCVVRQGEGKPKAPPGAREVPTKTAPPKKVSAPDSRSRSGPSTEPSKAASTPAPIAKGSGEPKQTASPKLKPSAEAKPRLEAKPRTETKPRAEAKPPAESKKKNDTKPPTKRAPATKQAGGTQRPLGGHSHTVAAKSLVRTAPRDPSNTAEPALRPPGAARPMVRQVTSRLVVPPRDVAEKTLAFRYANLDDAEAIAELERRGIAWTPATPPLPGVRTPIRLAGPLRGVRIHSTLPERERKTSPFEILDARLALALDDFCALLARHDVVEIVHYTMYRPPAELPPDLYKQIRHPAGLAIDLGAVRKADGRWLAIGPHWPSDIGAKTCGEGAREHWSRAGREIVSIACEAADLGIFHFILTPHFDAAHADHLHLEIKPDTRWFLVN